MVQDNRDRAPNKSEQIVHLTDPKILDYLNKVKRWRAGYSAGLGKRMFPFVENKASASKI